MTIGEGRDREGASADAAPEGDETKSQDDVKGRRKVPQQMPGEIGGPEGLEPTRYGDWDVNGRCTDF